MKFICLPHNPPFPFSFPHILACTHQPKMNCANFLPHTEPTMGITSAFDILFQFHLFIFFVSSLMRFVVAHIRLRRAKDKCVFNIGIDKTRLTKRSLFLISFWFVPWPRRKILHRVRFVYFPSPNTHYEQRERSTRLSEQKLELELIQWNDAYYRWSLKRQ